MALQDIALHWSSTGLVDAAWTQTAPTKTKTYLSTQASRSFPQGYTQVADPQKARKFGRLSDDLRVENRDRRLTCQRASRALWPSHCWPSRQHVAAPTQVTSKNSWSLTRFRLPLNPCSPVSSNKLKSKPLGQAFAPVSPQMRVPTRPWIPQEAV